MNVSNVKPFSFFTFLAFLCRFGENNSLHLHIMWFPWHQESIWPQWPLQPHFLKEFIELDVSIKSGIKKPYPGLLMWNGSSILLIFGTQVCWRLWRTRMLLLTKLKGHKSKSQDFISRTHNKDLLYCFKKHFWWQSYASLWHKVHSKIIKSILWKIPRVITRSSP